MLTAARPFVPCAARSLHASARRAAVTPFQMPAMSPTMSEGNIASWKKKEGESFAAGDVLLEIETDKATIDVEAQEDGILGKIIAPDGSKNIPVGNLIALLAEEGDDISNLEIPKQDASSTQPQSPSPPSPPPSAPTSEPATPHIHHGPPPEHSRPLFPSVHRLLLENNITNVDQIKGTGVRGMLTKGDVLTFLGKASGPLGTFKFGPSPIEEALAAKSKAGASGPAKQEAPKPLDGPAIRRLIVGNLLQSSKKQFNPAPNFGTADFDSVLSDYLPKSKTSSSSSKSPSTATPIPTSSSSPSFLDGLV